MAALRCKCRRRSVGVRDPSHISRLKDNNWRLPRDCPFILPRQPLGLFPSCLGPHVINAMQVCGIEFSFPAFALLACHL